MTPSTDKAHYAVCILAHNEQDRIVACLKALPVDNPAFRFFVVVNGSTDQTAEWAETFLKGRTNASVIRLPEGGKSRSWNRFIYDYAPAGMVSYFFVDGDAVIEAGSLEKMARMLNENVRFNAVSAPPLNGRSASEYREKMAEEKGLFGDLYCLSGHFFNHIHEAGHKLPDDLIGDDGMVRSWALTNLGTDHDWDSGRLGVCLDAGFYSETVQLANPAHLKMQFKRMINYSERRFQNLVITQIMRGVGVTALPRLISKPTSDFIRFRHIRKQPVYFLFDLLAFRRIKRKATQQVV